MTWEGLTGEIPRKILLNNIVQTTNIYIFKAFILTKRLKLCIAKNKRGYYGYIIKFKESVQSQVYHVILMLWLKISFVFVSGFSVYNFAWCLRDCLLQYVLSQSG